MTRRGEMQRARLREIARNMKSTDRKLRRDADRGHGPALDAWKAIHKQADEVLMPTKEEEK